MADRVREDGEVRLDDLPLKYRLLLRAYRWRRVADVSAATLARPLARARVALVSSAGLVPAPAPGFDLDRRGGDPSFRVIADDAPDESLAMWHRSDAFDRGPSARDLNVVFPRAALHRLVNEGVIGETAPRHLSFMGSITAPGALIRHEAPRAADVLAADGVDVALLVPV